jgi:hypothetical protein
MSDEDALNAFIEKASKVFADEETVSMGTSSALAMLIDFYNPPRVIALRGAVEALEEGYQTDDERVIKYESVRGAAMVQALALTLPNSPNLHVI